MHVVDEFQHLIGAVAVTQLLLAKRQMLISEMITPDMIAADVDLDQEEVMGVYRELDPTGEKENEYSVSETDPSSQ